MSKGGRGIICREGINPANFMLVVKDSSPSVCSDEVIYYNLGTPLKALL